MHLAGSHYKDRDDSARLIPYPRLQRRTTIPMTEWSAPEAAVFLRFVYLPEDACHWENLQAVQQHLPAVLEMAHELDAHRLQDKVEGHVPGGCRAGGAFCRAGWGGGALGPCCGAAVGSSGSRPRCRALAA